MNYLQLAQTMHRIVRAGQNELGSVPATVVSQTGLLGELVWFINQAWQDIQNEQPRWLFMIKRGTLALPVSNINVAFTTITDFDSLMLSNSDNRGRFITMYRDTVADEQVVRFVPYQDWAQSYLQRGDRGTGMPAQFTILPDGRLEFDLFADDDYTLRFDYRRTPQTLSIDADIPIMDSRYHMAIVWWAIAHYYCATRDSSQEFRAKSEINLKREMQKLRNEKLDEVLGYEVAP